ncbi:MAG: bacteriohemerythrin [Treponema sp.]|nr:bacteriohemerythrin [Treponema sp.]
MQKLHKYLPRSGSTDAHVIKYGETGDEEEKWKDGLAWTPDLETGNKVIDDQHKQIFRLTSNLIDACKKGRGHEMVGETLEFLANYTIHHFADEEDLQIRSGFPLYEEHKKLHEDFKKTVAGLIEEYNKSGAIGGLAEKINSAIVRWLVNHIQKEDAKIGKYINNNPAAGGLLDTNPSR